MSSPTITLYYRPGSCSLVPHALLHHLSIPFNTVAMRANAEKRFEAADGSFTHQDYRKINPTGYVPALVLDSGQVITELPAVLTYIACIAPPEQTEKLLGSSALDRARVIEWTNWLSGTFLGTSIAACARPYRFTDGDDARKAVAEKGWENILECYARVESKLDGREYAVGDGLTVVDFYLYYFRRSAVYMTGMGGSLFGEKYPNFERLQKMVEGLEGVQEILKVEELKPVYE
ncbi:hypothetical protein CORC01_00647 [Colletotrichum orchidophilum]|uniref:Glutathione S-transferase n=1 Tax=Colletotrichum orchidophilum TaxID=1209926 RepID=A0A1G4BSC8_9PEZI|nr:uncharacterized protein CORC01_00647 [Colletotrichum orchidophilum]OHF04308.1 hypothetical protein CORC01_00647 [Colletotrichum orchidophilum]